MCAQLCDEVPDLNVCCENFVYKADFQVVSPWQELGFREGAPNYLYKMAQTIYLGTHL